MISEVLQAKHKAQQTFLNAWINTLEKYYLKTLINFISKSDRAPFQSHQ
jgi:hypothetical protein